MNNTIQLKAQITKLKQEKEQLRLFLHELVEAHYRVINQAPAEGINPNSLDDNEEKEVNHE